jgi:hypothetical protein
MHLLSPYPWAIALPRSHATSSGMRGSLGCLRGHTPTAQMEEIKVMRGRLELDAQNSIAFCVALRSGSKLCSGRLQLEFQVLKITSSTSNAGSPFCAVHVAGSAMSAVRKRRLER